MKVNKYLIILSLISNFLSISLCSALMLDFSPLNILPEADNNLIDNNPPLFLADDSPAVHPGTVVTYGDTENYRIWIKDNNAEKGGYLIVRDVTEEESEDKTIYTYTLKTIKTQKDLDSSSIENYDVSQTDGIFNSKRTIIKDESGVKEIDEIKDYDFGFFGLGESTGVDIDKAHQEIHIKNIEIKEDVKEGKEKVELPDINSFPNFGEAGADELSLNESITKVLKSFEDAEKTLLSYFKKADISQIREYKDSEGSVIQKEELTRKIELTREIQNGEEIQIGEDVDTEYHKSVKGEEARYIHIWKDGRVKKYEGFFKILGEKVEFNGKDNSRHIEISTSKNKNIFDVLDEDEDGNMLTFHTTIPKRADYTHHDLLDSEKNPVEFKELATISGVTIPVDVHYKLHDAYDAWVGEKVTPWIHKSLEKINGMWVSDENALSYLKNLSDGDEVIYSIDIDLPPAPNRPLPWHIEQVFKYEKGDLKLKETLIDHDFGYGTVIKLNEDIIKEVAKKKNSLEDDYKKAQLLNYFVNNNKYMNKFKGLDENKLYVEQVEGENGIRKQMQNYFESNNIDWIDNDVDRFIAFAIAYSDDVDSHDYWFRNKNDNNKLYREKWIFDLKDFKVAIAPSEEKSPWALQRYVPNLLKASDISGYKTYVDATIDGGGQTEFIPDDYNEVKSGSVSYFLGKDEFIDMYWRNRYKEESYDDFIKNWFRQSLYHRWQPADASQSIPVGAEQGSILADFFKYTVDPISSFTFGLFGFPGKTISPMEKHAYEVLERTLFNQVTSIKNNWTEDEITKAITLTYKYEYGKKYAELISGGSSPADAHKIARDYVNFILYAGLTAIYKDEIKGDLLPQFVPKTWVEIGAQSFNILSTPFLLGLAVKAPVEGAVAGATDLATNEGISTGKLWLTYLSGVSKNYPLIARTMLTWGAFAGSYTALTSALSGESKEEILDKFRMSYAFGLASGLVYRFTAIPNTIMARWIWPFPKIASGLGLGGSVLLPESLQARLLLSRGLFWGLLKFSDRFGSAMLLKYALEKSVHTTINAAGWETNELEDLAISFVSAIAGIDVFFPGNAGASKFSGLKKVELKPDPLNPEGYILKIDNIGIGTVDKNFTNFEPAPQDKLKGLSDFIKMIIACGLPQTIYHQLDKGRGK
jgi:hypothetical protein